MLRWINGLIQVQNAQKMTFTDLKSHWLHDVSVIWKLACQWLRRERREEKGVAGCDWWDGQCSSSVLIGWEHGDIIPLILAPVFDQDRPLLVESLPVVRSFWFKPWTHETEACCLLCDCDGQVTFITDRKQTRKHKNTAQTWRDLLLLRNSAVN